MVARSVALLLLLFLAHCSNNPYPDADGDRKVLYASFSSPPKTLDPAVAYSVVDHEVTGAVYDTLLEYHYLKRPYTLIPGLASAVPVAEATDDGHVLYRFGLRPGLLYGADPALSASAANGAGRTVVAADVAFALARLADPAVNSPVSANFGKIVGFDRFAELLQERREDPDFAQLPAHEQYAAAGGIPGIRALSPTELEIELEAPYPQILYWFAMPFTAPVPWEAIAHYDGRDGRDHFADHPVGAGPFRLVEYDRRRRIVLERNENWYGRRHPEWNAPGAVYPAAGEPGDAQQGLLAASGTPLPFLERIELRRDPESVPTFFKFTQGYYDASGLIRESFDRFIQEGELSAEMAGRGTRLSKSVQPDVYYLGFNMDDPIVGAPAGRRGRALRQAMSLAVDVAEYLRIFWNNRGVSAQSPIPPGIFGYRESYRNPFRSGDLEHAVELLVEAGYAGGLDPATGRPLRLSFDANDTSARARLQFQYFAERWRRLGLNVEVRATNYNQFQDKVRNGAYQIFSWGWVADYPDPENFLFLLSGPMSRTRSGGPNTANFSDPEYDRLFEAMRAMPNDTARLELIDRMLAIIERERPWIELYHREDYTLHHIWLKNVKAPGLSLPTAKYQDIDPGQRKRLRAAWNGPIRWPAYFGGILLFVGAIAAGRRNGGRGALK
jgi:oligopeptide transport system substrate-binding protein